MSDNSFNYDDAHLRHVAEIYDYVAEVTNPAAFSAPQNAYSKIPFQTVIYDPNKMWDAALGAFRIPFTGLWRIEGALRGEATVSQYRYLLVAAVNGVGSADTDRRLYDGIAGALYVQGTTTTISMATAMIGSSETLLYEGDLLELYVLHNVPGTRSYPLSTFRHENRLMLRAVRRFELGQLPLHPY